MPGSHTFTRKRKMGLAELLQCSLVRRGLTTEMELWHYFHHKQEKGMRLSKQGYLQQRKRLNPEVFHYLNQEYLSTFYQEDKPITWNGYLLAAIDSSKAEVPNSEENRRTFGQSNNQHTQNGQVRALVSGAYDVLNHFYLDLQIGAISSSESEIAKRHFHNVSKVVGDSSVLLIFDRGYPSIEFIDYLQEQGFMYLFRLSSNDYKQERERMSTTDEIVNLKHTKPRLRKIRKNHPQRADALEHKQHTSVRILKTKLFSGQELTMMTNLPKEHSATEIQKLYFLRWEIEKKYHTLKNKMKLESVTGKASIYVYQDFLAQILTYNMMQDIRKAADSNVTSNLPHGKNPMRTNENIAIGLFKERLVFLLLESDGKKRSCAFQTLQTEMESYLLPIRTMPSQQRSFHLSNKYCNNQKSSF